MESKLCLMCTMESTLVPKFDNMSTSGLMISSRAFKSDVLDEVFRPSQITHLVNPKKDRLRRVFMKMARSLEPNGLFVFYYAGHGTSIKGRLAQDEAFDQALVCFDGLLLDDELTELIKKFQPNHELITIIDACASETVIEWNQVENKGKLPAIMHIAAAADNDVAEASTLGAKMTKFITDQLEDGDHEDFTYDRLASKLQGASGLKCKVKFSNKANHTLRNKKLFN